MHSLTRYLVRRLFTSAVTLLGISIVVFALVRLLPGDPARTIAGVLASEDDVARIRGELGLDKPLLQQYATFLAHLARGDLGTSARTKQPVAEEIRSRFPHTAKLALASMILATVIGVPAGVLAAVRRGTSFDYLVSLGTLAGNSMPVYWLGLMLIVLFAVKLRWLPAAGADQPRALVLPSVTLAAFSLALITRMTRSSMLEVLGQDSIRTARAKGLAERVVILRHALRNALIPIVTVIGLQFGGLLGGAVLTESVFGWPGMGLLLVDSIFARDYPMIQGIVLIYAVLILVLNFLIDILYGLLDPRIHYD